MNLFTRIINNIFKNAVVIFVYHDVSNKPSNFSVENDLNISPEVFLSQVKTINNVFNIISPIELIDGNFERPAALFTFDDGFKSYFDNALPILEKFNCPSITFINYDVINGELFWPGLTTYLCNYDTNYAKYKKTNQINSLKKPEFMFLDENDVNKYIKKTNNRGLINLVKTFQGEFANQSDLEKSKEFYMSFLGSHLYKHLNCANISYNRLIQMQKRNVNYLSRYSNFINYFAYPFGQPIMCFNNETNNILNKQKVKKIFSSSSTINYDISQYLLDRMDLNEKVSNEQTLFTHLAKRLFHNKIKRYFL